MVDSAARMSASTPIKLIADEDRAVNKDTVARAADDEGIVERV